MRSVHKEIQKAAFVTGETSMKHKEHAAKNKTAQRPGWSRVQYRHDALLSRHQESAADACLLESHWASAIFTTPTQNSSL